MCATSHVDALTVSVVDSRFDPPQIVHQHDLKGSRVRWLRAGTRDDLFRIQIAVDVVDHGEETACLLRASPAGASPSSSRGRCGGAT